MTRPACDPQILNHLPVNNVKFISYERYWDLHITHVNYMQMKNGKFIHQEISVIHFFSVYTKSRMDGFWMSRGFSLVARLLWTWIWQRTLTKRKGRKSDATTQFVALKTIVQNGWEGGGGNLERGRYLLVDEWAQFCRNTGTIKCRRDWRIGKKLSLESIAHQGIISNEKFFNDWSWQVLD